MRKLHKAVAGLAVAGSLIAAALLGGSGGALADSPGYRSVKDAPYEAPFSWTGFYVGANIGAATGINASGETFVNGPPLVAGNVFDAKSFSGTDRTALTAGVHGGYNWQFAPNWVVGVEGDYTRHNADVSNISVSNTIAGVVNPTALNMSNKDNALYSVRGRLGYAVDKWMLYATLGGAWRDSQHTGFLMSSPGAAINTTSIAFSTMTSGLAAGGGIEYAVTKNIILGAEYLYYGVGSTTTRIASCPACAQFGPSTFSWKNDDIQEVRARLSVKF